MTDSLKCQRHIPAEVWQSDGRHCCRWGGRLLTERQSSRRTNILCLLLWVRDGPKGNKHVFTCRFFISWMLFDIYVQKIFPTWSLLIWKSKDCVIQIKTSNVFIALLCQAPLATVSFTGICPLAVWIKRSTKFETKWAKRCRITPPSFLALKGVSLV